MSAQNLSIFLATPCYGGLAYALYMQSLLALRSACAARGVGLHVDLGGGEALIGRARAAMMAKFLASPATHLLFIDADVGFTPDAVFRLAAARRDVVGGAYPRKTQPDSGPLTFEYEPLAEAPPATGDGFVQAASVGTGFLLISRAAAQRLVGAYPQLKAQLGDTHQVGVPAAAMLFDSFVDPATGRYLSDHEAFCHRWRAIGGEVWVDLESGLSHVGAVVHTAATHPA